MWHIVSQRYCWSAENDLGDGLGTLGHTLLLSGIALQAPYNRYLGIVIPITSAKSAIVVTLIYFVQSLVRRLSIFDAVLVHIDSIIDSSPQRCFFGLHAFSMRSSPFCLRNPV